MPSEATPVGKGVVGFWLRAHGLQCLSVRGDLLQQKVCYPEDQATYPVGREGDSQVGIYFANLFSGCEEPAAACLRAELQTEPVLISSHLQG